MKKPEIAALFVTALLLTFTLGYFVGRSGSNSVVSFSPTEAIAISAATTTPAFLEEPVDETPTPSPTPAAPIETPEPTPDSAEPSATPADEPKQTSGTATVSSVEPTAEATPATESHYIDGKLRINLATQAELEGLPGIGPAIAERIIAYRTRNGDFRRITTLKSIEGIGDKRYEAIKDLVTVD